MGKLQMECLGFEPETAELKAQTNPVNYGISPQTSSLYFCLGKIKFCANHISDFQFITNASNCGSKQTKTIPAAEAMQKIGINW